MSSFYFNFWSFLHKNLPPSQNSPRKKSWPLPGYDVYEIHDMQCVRARAHVCVCVCVCVCKQWWNLKLAGEIELRL